VRLRLIPDIVRNVPAMADATLEWALAGRGRGVVALGLSGSESRFPSEPFREHFAAAAREGLHCVAHAGEHAGPASIRSVLDVCKAERIGHGVRAAEDPTLVEELRERRIPLEVCPSSNVCLGVVPDLAHHPFDRLLQAGCRVTVNSDDGPFFSTSLSEEYLRLQKTFGYSARELAGFARAALDAAFLPEDEHAALAVHFQEETDQLLRDLVP
jgi:adenosine deaminase